MLNIKLQSDTALEEVFSGYGGVTIMVFKMCLTKEVAAKYDFSLNNIVP